MTFRRALAWTLVALLLLTGQARAQTFAPAANPRNMLIGGDFSTNPWQRGVNFTGVTTPRYTADRWFVYGIGGQTASGGKNVVSSSVLTGFNSVMTVLRTAGNTNLGQICAGQIIESASALAAAGQPSTFSVYVNKAPNFSALNSLVSVAVHTGTGIDEGAAADLAGWTGAQTPLAATQAVETGFKRFSFPVTIPTNATEISVYICFTPVGTAGASDGFSFTGAQFELGAVTQFERRPVGWELALAQRYLLVLSENVALRCSGAVITTTDAQILCRVPVTMRTPATALVTGGTWAVTGATGTPIAATGIVSGNPATDACVMLVSVAGGLVAGNATFLQGQGTSGMIACDSELH